MPSVEDDPFGVCDGFGCRNRRVAFDDDTVSSSDTAMTRLLLPVKLSPVFAIWLHKQTNSRSNEQKCRRDSRTNALFDSILQRPLCLRSSCQFGQHSIRSCLFVALFVIATNLFFGLERNKFKQTVRHFCVQRLTNNQNRMESFFFRCRCKKRAIVQKLIQIRFFRG